MVRSGLESNASSNVLALSGKPRTPAWVAHKGRADFERVGRNEVANADSEKNYVVSRFAGPFVAASVSTSTKLPF